MLRACLSRLLVVHCGSSSQLLLTLHYLETSLSSRPSLSLLLIDSISAFYWLDRCGGGESVARQEDKLTKCSEFLSRLLRCVCVCVCIYCFVFPCSSESVQNDVIHLIDILLFFLFSFRDYRITVFATSHAIRRNYKNIATPSSSSSSSPSYSEYEQPYLCRPWQRLVTHRLLCSRGTPGTNMAAAACTEEQSRRQAFNVRCVSYSSSSSTKEAKAHKSSSFHVTDRGVVFV